MASNPWLVRLPQQIPLDIRRQRRATGQHLRSPETLQSQPNNPQNLAWAPGSHSPVLDRNQLAPRVPSQNMLRLQQDDDVRRSLELTTAQLYEFRRVPWAHWARICGLLGAEQRASRGSAFGQKNRVHSWLAFGGRQHQTKWSDCQRWVRQREWRRLLSSKRTKCLCPANINLNSTSIFYLMSWLLFFLEQIN